jgi:hypothetical protein
VDHHGQAHRAPLVTALPQVGALLLGEPSAWDGNDRQPRPALLPFSSEVTSMDSGSFFLFIVCMTLICLIWSRDDRRPQ